ncbi:TatD-related deoxyribonuclease [Cellulomonas flavigena DSM 20109]|uniref:TatD-related deoxyribonuclease n=1 Tax=Cellulomonas flavigena (strain ATCC 482 / DSM 20109 / BCRC 11376 / JCM 18109 / NBRC 3775 / NCIMB 8073 / NRS 134) TaxID=446466 RepID=D5UK19_CELFN|nr:TatD family hydrolase [Cellulomonas flavigena]ADG73761.1 TatD-related deoxyribonuclease [Cellulomonas flavigena DSM 20109]
MGRRSRATGWPAAPEPLPSPVVDNHTHLESVVGWRADGWDPADAAAHPDLAAHLERAAQVGVTRMVQVGCDLDALAWTDAAVRAHPALLGAVAIHPNEAVLHAGVHEVAPDGLDPDPQPRHDVPLDDAIAAVAAVAARNPRVRAIGETGLDHFRAGERGRAVQREAFRAHVALAKELGLALQIHDRDAHAEVVEVLLADGAPERTVFHCFSGDAGLARVAAEHGWYCSFAGPVSFPANEALRDALRVLPASLVLVETDAPYLTVHPLRGRPNSPYLLPGTLRAVAEATGRSLADVCAQVSAVSQAVYGDW